MSRAIGIGDKVRVTDPNNQSQEYFIREIDESKKIIYVSQNLTDPRSRFSGISYSQGLKAVGAEQIPFRFEFLPVQPSSPPSPSLPVQPSSPPSPVHPKPPSPPLPVQTLADVFTQPRLDLTELYQNVPPLVNFDFRTVRDWLDLPQVRFNLYERAKVDLVIFPFNEVYTQQITFQSPSLTILQRHILEEILPSYVLSEPKSLETGQPDARLTEDLLRAGTGTLGINTPSVYQLFEYLYPSQHIQKVPDDGDCYFSSLGLFVNRSSLQVRADLSRTFSTLTPDEQSDLVNDAINGCGAGTFLRQAYQQDPRLTIVNFSNLLLTNCGQGNRDCESCIWGGNFLDDLSSKTYQRPILSVGITPQTDQQEVSFSEFNPNIQEFILGMFQQWQPDFWNPQNQTLTFSILNQNVALTTYPLFSDEPMTSTQFSAYIIDAGKHVDAILPRS